MSLIEELKYNLLFITVALLLAFGLYTTIGLALGTEVPVVAVTSPSMEPELQRGDLVLIRGEPFEDIEVGNIVIYESEYMEVPIIHRTIDRTDDTIETKGDNNNHQVTACVRPDGTYAMTDQCPNGELVNLEQDISEEQVLGTAFFRIPAVGHLKLFPTCVYMELTGQLPPDSPVCPN